MKAMNLYLLTRAEEERNFSLLAAELSGDRRHKHYSRHEVLSLCSLVEGLIPCLRERSGPDGGWISYLDGFYLSYTIAHISKEFDLLKISEDGKCVLNIELKSEAIEEDRISRQLSQNRYYLTHISTTIYSYTYVMETNTLYNLNEKGYMRACGMEELAELLSRPAFERFVEKDLEQLFKASDYLISPVDAPSKFLQGSYFLTNQQFEFKKRILELLREEEGDRPPLIAVSGSAGTGKTLLLFDLALELSKKKKVLILLGGKLQDGHRILDERLKKVWIRRAEEDYSDQEWSCILVDEANRMPAESLERLLDYAESEETPCILAFDPRRVKEPEDKDNEIRRRIREFKPLVLSFTGNIRINRPIYAFLRGLFNKKENTASADLGGIDVLYAGDRESAGCILDYYAEKGYHRILLPGGGGEKREGLGEDDIVGLEIEKVAVVLDERFYYDEDQRLCARGDSGEEALTLLYEGISRTREMLCVVVMGSEELLSEIMEIKSR